MSCLLFDRCILGHGLHIRLKDLVDGKIKVSALKKISVVDLLGRDPVAPRPELMSSDITGKTVMVTGAGGSIGSELCRQILKCRPSKLLLFELSEFSLYSIDKELRETQAAAGSQIEGSWLLQGLCTQRIWRARSHTSRNRAGTNPPSQGSTWYCPRH